MRTPQRPTPLVAREAVLEQLWTAVTDSVESGMRALLVHGPAGIGKTRVLDGFAERARGLGAAVIAGRSPAVGTHAHGALADMLGGYLRSTPPAAADLRRAGDALARLVPGLAAGAGDPTAPAPDALATVQAAYRLVDIVTERRPLVLVLDDAHAADAETCEVLDALRRHARALPWTLVLGWRDPAARGVAHDLVADLRRQGELVDIALEPLDAAATGGLMGALLGEGLPAAGFIAMVHQRTAGNPYYVEEMTRWLLDTGRLHRAGIQWLHASGCEDELPPSIDEALLDRIRVLPAAARSILEWLAAAGGRADLSLLEASIADDPAALVEGLDQLAASGLVGDRGLRSTEYEVHHPLVAECAYHSMGAARRRLRHRRLAQVLAERGAHPAVVAVHATRGADRGDRTALAAAMRAGTEAEARLQYARAVSWYREALDLADGDAAEERTSALDRVSELSGHAGELELGLAATGELLRHEDAADPVRRATLLRRAAFLHVLSGDTASARAAIDEGLALAMDGGGSAALLLAELASVATLTMPSRDGLDFLSHSRALAGEEGAAARERALILGTFEAMAVAQEGHPRRSLEMARELAADAMAGGHVLAFGYAVFSSAIASMLLGRFTETEGALTSVLHTVTDDMGLMWGAASGWSIYSQVLLNQGRVDEAWDAVLRSEEIARRHATMMLPAPMINGAMLLAERGDTAAAHERLTEARSLLARGCTPVYETWYWAGRALAAEAEARPEVALAAYESMWATAHRFNNRGVAISLRPGQVLALVECGRAAEAVAVGREVVDGLDQPDAPAGLAHALGALAVALAADGLSEEAHDAAVRAADLAGDLEALRPRAIARATAGLALRQLGDTARAVAVLRPALEELEAMGWRPRAAQVRRLLDECGPGSAAEPVAAHVGAPTFSPRERQVIDLAVAGLSSRGIGLRLTLSERTVENHLARIYAKLDVHSRAELIARMATKAG